MAAVQALAFFARAGFSGWMFYASVSSGSTAYLNVLHFLTPLCSYSEFDATRSNLPD